MTGIMNIISMDLLRESHMSNLQVRLKETEGVLPPYWTERIGEALRHPSVWSVLHPLELQ